MGKTKDLYFPERDTKKLKEVELWKNMLEIKWLNCAGNEEILMTRTSRDVDEIYPSGKSG